jgi:rare lipoprotein A
MREGFPLVHRLTATGVFCCFVLVAAAGCAPAPRLTRAKEKAAAHGFRQTGTAVYYALRFQGKKTASGERFDVQKFTAAHRTLPFGTKVRVTNLGNKKSVVVRINDRGPFGAGGHIIDLSPAAAHAIGLGRQGVARVLLTLVK